MTRRFRTCPMLSLSLSLPHATYIIVRCSCIVRKRSLVPLVEVKLCNRHIAFSHILRIVRLSYTARIAFGNRSGQLVAPIKSDFLLIHSCITSKRYVCGFHCYYVFPRFRNCCPIISVTETIFFFWFIISSISENASMLLCILKIYRGTDCSHWCGVKSHLCGYLLLAVECRTHDRDALQEVIVVTKPYGIRSWCT